MLGGAGSLQLLRSFLLSRCRFKHVVTAGHVDHERDEQACCQCTSHGSKLPAFLRLCHCRLLKAAGLYGSILLCPRVLQCFRPFFIDPLGFNSLPLSSDGRVCCFIIGTLCVGLLLADQRLNRLHHAIHKVHAGQLRLDLPQSLFDSAQVGDSAR
ncbi:MAG: hypothetical protein DWI25_08350 [Planctomycetota bacterium]|nr:MAG: hypothetical protein DWI25_08350 [Planctomycetota bacterium]